MLIDLKKYNSSSLKIVNEIEYYYDETYSKWFSRQIFEINFRLSIRPVTGNRYLNIFNVPSNINGYHFIKNSTIRQIQIINENTVTADFELEVNGSNVSTISLNNESEKFSNLDIDVYSKNMLSCLVNSINILKNIDVYLIYSYLHQP